MNCISLGDNDEPLDGVRNILNEREMNLWQAEGPQFNRKSGHRRYQHFNNRLPYNYQEPISSSRFFLERVGESGKSSINMN